MSLLHGIAASSGIAIAKAYCLVEPDLSFSKKTVEDIPEELARFQSLSLFQKVSWSQFAIPLKKNLVQMKQQSLMHIY